MTYYKYAERDVAKQLDWSIFGDSMDKMFQGQIDKEQAKQADLENTSRELLTKLDDVPLGEHKGLNQWALEGGATLSNQMLQLNRDLKSRKISYRDYIKQRQSLIDGTNNTFQVINEYNKYYSDVMQKYQNKEADGQTLFELGLLEGFNNFSNTQLIVNPADNSVSIAQMVKDPETGQMKVGEVASVNSLRNRLQQVVAPVDVKSQINAGVKVLGKHIEVISDGMVLTREDITSRPEYLKAEDDFINSMLVNPRQVGSIMHDYLKINPTTGVPYQYTKDKELAAKDPNMILLEIDPENPSSGRLVPKLEEKQLKEVREALRNEMRSQLNFVETPQPPDRPVRTPASTDEKKWQVERKAYTKRVRRMMNMAGLLYYGNSDQVNTASNYFKGTNKDIVSIKRHPDKLVVQTQTDGGTIRTTEIGYLNADGTPKSQKDFIQQLTILTNEDDINYGLEMGMYDPDKPFSADSEGGADTDVDKVPKKIDSYAAKTVGTGKNEISLSNEVAAAIGKSKRRVNKKDVEIPPNERAASGFKAAISAQGADYSGGFKVDVREDGSLAISLPRVFGNVKLVFKKIDLDKIEKIAIPLLYDANQEGRKMTVAQFNAQYNSSGGSTPAKPKTQPKSTTEEVDYSEL